jgi:anti-anti-sigma factor
MSDEFDVQTEMVPGERWCFVSPGSSTWHRCLAWKASGPCDGALTTVIDLSECTFLDSSGVRVLASAGRKLSEAGRRFAIVVSNPSVLRVLEITGVDTMLAVHHSTESALAAPPA